MWWERICWGRFSKPERFPTCQQTQVEAHKMPVRKATGKQLDMNDHVMKFQVWVQVLTRVSLLEYFTHHFRVHAWCDIAVMLGGHAWRWTIPCMASIERHCMTTRIDTLGLYFCFGFTIGCWI